MSLMVFAITTMLAGVAARAYRRIAGSARPAPELVSNARRVKVIVVPPPVKPHRHRDAEQESGVTCVSPVRTVATTPRRVVPCPGLTPFRIPCPPYESPRSSFESEPSFLGIDQRRRVGPAECQV